MHPRRPLIVPEPTYMKFEGAWVDFDGFSNMLEFIAREFNVGGGSWEIVEVRGPGTGLRVLPNRRVEVWGDKSIYIPTLLQLVMQGCGEIPVVEIRESLAFSFRGFHLDVARGGVARVDFIKKLLKWLFILKYNYLALYVEDLFPWGRHPEIGARRGRYTDEEWREIVEYGEKLGIEVFPSLELSGHMERILVLDKYRHLAEWPVWPGMENILGSGVLDLSNPEARRFAEELLEEALEKTKSRFIHIGGDETWILGRGRSLDRLGRFEGPRLYAEHHSKLIRMVREKGKTPILWGDMISAAYLGHLGIESSPWVKLLDEAVWREALIANWDYTPTEDVGRFARSIKLFEEKGFKQIVCPGLWNWNLFYPDFERALANLRGFLRAARTSTSVEGFLVTAWGDDGCESLYSYLYPLILAAMEIAEGSGAWEEKWLALSGESREVFEFRLVAGRSQITRALKAFIARGEAPPSSVADEMKKVLSRFEGVELPGDLEFVRNAMKTAVRRSEGLATASEMIRLATEYAELWLSERKPANLDYVYTKFWATAARIELEKIVK